MGCCSGFIKQILFVFNLLFAFSGIALLVVGILAQQNVSDLPSFLQGPPITFIVTGCIIFVIAFFGCCGAIKKNTCMLNMYAVLLIVVFLIQMVIGIYVLLNWKEDGDKITTPIKDLFKKAKEGDNDAKEAFSNIEKSLKCCGFDGPSDYSPSNPPDSCKNPDSGNTVFVKGCGAAFKEWVLKYKDVIGGVAIGFAVVEIVGVILACILASNIKKKH